MTAVERLESLLADLDGQQPRLDLLHAYYRGRSAEPYIPRQAGDELRKLAGIARTRWAGLVVESVAERLVVDGVACTDPRYDGQVWSWWQGSALDARQGAVHVDALICSDTHVLVQPGAGGGPPAIRGLDRRDSIGRPSGWDPWLLSEAAYRWRSGGAVMAALYDAEARHLFARAAGTAAVEVARWWRDDPDRVLVLPGSGWVLLDASAHGMGSCPVVRVANVPDLRGAGESDIEDHIPAIDRITETALGRLTAGKFGAYRQRWATGQPLADMVDPRTGEPVLGPDGKPVPAGSPFRYGSDMVWVSEDPDTKFGDFAATDLRPIIEALDQDIKHLAAATRTPAHYLLAGIANPPSAEALLAAQDGLMAKVERRRLDFGEAWEHVLRLAGRAAGVDAVAEDAGLQVVWRNTEVRSLGAVADAMLKLRQMGLPLRLLLEMQGMSPQTIDRALADAAAEQAEQARTQATAFGA